MFGSELSVNYQKRVSPLYMHPRPGVRAYAILTDLHHRRIIASCALTDYARDLSTLINLER